MNKGRLDRGDENMNAEMKRDFARKKADIARLKNFIKKVVVPNHNLHHPHPITIHIMSSSFNYNLHDIILIQSQST